MGGKVGIRRILFSLLLAAALPASATTVFVTGLGAFEAQVIVNGSAVYALRVGESSPEGVRLQAIEGSTALMEVDRRLVRLAIGQSYSPDVAVRIGADGQYRLTAHLNGVPMRAIVDTGASTVAIGYATAQRLGIDYRAGKRSIAHTANGSVATYLVNIPRVQVGEIVVINVLASVQEGTPTISNGIDVLLGNSFLRHVELIRTPDGMMLRRAGGN